MFCRHSPLTIGNITNLIKEIDPIINPSDPAPMWALSADAEGFKHLSKLYFSDLKTRKCMVAAVVLLADVNVLQAGGTG